MSEAEGAVRCAAEVIAREKGMATRDVLKPRGLIAKRARHEALYLAVTEAGLSVRQVSRVTGLARDAIARKLGQIEDQRDDADVDGRLERLGRQVARAVA